MASFVMIVVMVEWLLLLGAGFVGGLMNAIAGGGSFIIYPVLLGLGVPPVSANASGSLIVLPGQASAAFGYRQYLRTLSTWYYLLLIPGAVGGLLGAFLLSRTSDATFERIVPWFIIAAAVLLLAQPRLHAWLYNSKHRAARKKHRVSLGVMVCLGVLAISVYGGYFGAGFGIMMLAFLGLTKLTNIHQMNGLKNVIGTLLTMLIVVYFISQGLIAWQALPLLLLGNTIGGWVGATYSEKLPTKLLRGIIIVIAFILAGVLFIRTY